MSTSKLALKRRSSVLSPWKIPSKVHSQWLLLLFFVTLISTASHPSLPLPSYSLLCGATIPESTPTAAIPGSFLSFHPTDPYFSGGTVLFGQANFPIRRSFSFDARTIHRTLAPGILKIEGELTIRGSRARLITQNQTYFQSLFSLVFHPKPRFFFHGVEVTFQLAGFWSEFTGELCMAGSGTTVSEEGNFLDLTAVLKLNYPKTSDIFTSLITGVVEISMASYGLNRSFLVSLMAYHQNDYKYLLIRLAKRSCSHIQIKGRRLEFETFEFCHFLRKDFLRARFKLEHTAKNRALRYKFMSWKGIDCFDDGLVRMYLVFSNLSYSDYFKTFDPETTMLAEGIWDWNRSRLCLAACHIVNMGDPLKEVSVGDCSIRICLWFPAVMSVMSMSPAVGRLWSDRKEADVDHFSIVTLRIEDTDVSSLLGAKYMYTKMDMVNDFCLQDSVERASNINKDHIKKMKFNIAVRNALGESAWGHAVPVSVGEFSYHNIIFKDLSQLAMMNQSIWNVSYRISYMFHHFSSDEYKLVEILAEGTYAVKRRALCMVGCRYLGFSVAEKMKAVSSMDCSFLIKVDVSHGELLHGKIKSIREKSDPLYFEPLEIVHEVQLGNSIWRMNMKVTIVIISISISLVSISLQLFDVKKHPHVLTSTSLMMIMFLMISEIIPAVLSFQALIYMYRNRQDVFLTRVGWVETNAFAMAVITVMVFVLELRFLRLVWRARIRENGLKELGLIEWKSLQACLPIYFSWVLIFWLIWPSSYRIPSPHPIFIAELHHSLAEKLIYIANSIFEGFLLPQVTLNIVLCSKGKILRSLFYVGLTLARALPHVYDVYRVGCFAFTPDTAFCSSIWDVIMHCRGVIIAFLLYLQQLFGSSCIIPPMFRSYGG